LRRSGPPHNLSFAQTTPERDYKWRRIVEEAFVAETRNTDWRDRAKPAKRPHSSLDYQTPVEFAANLKEEASASMQATGRDAGPSRPGPLLNRPATGIRNHQQGMPFQAKTGPKK
jgi:hypothetical protein